MNQKQNSDIITDALKNLASSAKKPKKKILKTYVINHKKEIEAALDQGYTWEEIAQEMKRATKEAFPGIAHSGCRHSPCNASQVHLYYPQGRCEKTKTVS